MIQSCCSQDRAVKWGANLFAGVSLIALLVTALALAVLFVPGIATAISVGITTASLVAAGSGLLFLATVIGAIFLYTRSTPSSENKNRSSLPLPTLTEKFSNPPRNVASNSPERPNKETIVKKRKSTGKTENAPVIDEYRPFLDSAPKKMVNKILQSSYSAEEKEFLPLLAKDVYAKGGKPIGPKDLCNARTSREYLDYLSIKFPDFLPISVPSIQSTFQFEVEKMNQCQIDEIIGSLPARIKEKTIFGGLLRINQNHRTAFIIDVTNATLEYYNSCGSDEEAKSCLISLVKALSTKFNKEFKYIHSTKDIPLQTDVYQCGIWSCKLIEFRLENRQNLDLQSCVHFDIGKYRRKVYGRVLRYKFYHAVGCLRVEQAGQTPSQIPNGQLYKMGKRDKHKS